MNYFLLDEYPNIRFPLYRRMKRDLWKKVRLLVFSRDNGHCRYCNTETFLNKCHIHHVLELSEGGTNFLSNLKTLCKLCHKKRHPFMFSIQEKYL